MLKKISFRLGMEGGLLIGICLGTFIAASFILCMLLLLNTTVVIVVTMALIIASILSLGIVFFMQNKRENSQRQLCTCRYRSSLYTYCRKCALKDKESDNESPAKPDLPDE